MCGMRDAAHGEKGLTERGPACDHGSSTYSSLLSTYSRASADCSASHRSRPTPDSLVDMAPKPRRGGVCDGRKRSASSSSAVRGGSTIRPQAAKHFWRSAESNEHPYARLCIRSSLPRILTLRRVTSGDA